jgi:gas vesicle protein
MPDERAETDQTQSQATSNIAWFLTGAFIGAAAAILYTPQSGKESRKLISEKTHQGREAVESAAQDIADASKTCSNAGANWWMTPPTCSSAAANSSRVER